MGLILIFCPLSANPKKLSNTPKQFVDSLPMNCLSLFDHFVGLALKGLSICHFQCYRLIWIFWIFSDGLRFLISRWTCFFTIYLYDVRSLILTCSQFQQQQRIFFFFDLSFRVVYFWNHCIKYITKLKEVTKTRNVSVSLLGHFADQLGAYSEPSRRWSFFQN